MDTNGFDVIRGRDHEWMGEWASEWTNECRYRLSFRCFSDWRRLFESVGLMNWEKSEGTQKEQQKKDAISGQKKKDAKRTTKKKSLRSSVF